MTSHGNALPPLSLVGVIVTQAPAGGCDWSALTPMMRCRGGGSCWAVGWCSVAHLADALHSATCALALRTLPLLSAHGGRCPIS